MGKIKYKIWRKKSKAVEGRKEKGGKKVYMVTCRKRANKGGRREERRKKAEKMGRRKKREGEKKKAMKKGRVKRKGEDMVIRNLEWRKK